jgi:hypothetical protein
MGFTAEIGHTRTLRETAHLSQTDRHMVRTNGEYLKFHDQPASSPRDIVGAWWAKFGHYWAPADSTR